MDFFKEYRYSTKATFFSAFFSLVSIAFLILIIYCFLCIENPVLMFLGVVASAAAAVFCYVYVSRTLADKIAEKDFKKKITTNVRFAYEFCKQNPEYFESVAADNPDFSEKYRMDSDGIIYKLDED